MLVLKNREKKAVEDRLAATLMQSSLSKLLDCNNFDGSLSELVGFLQLDWTE